MQVTIINGQNHKGSTYHIGRLLAEKVASPEQITEFFLPRDMPHFCTGCNQCFLKSETACPHYEALSPLTKAMDDADLIILTSPVYVFHATGSMKAFLDHYGYRWMVHRPNKEMFRKQAVVISTAAGGGMKYTCKDMAHSCFSWGIPKIYRFGSAVRATNWDSVSVGKKIKIDRKMTQIARRIQQNTGHVSVPVKTKGFFHIVRILQKKVMENPADKAYWEANGWDGKSRPWK